MAKPYIEITANILSSMAGHNLEVFLSKTLSKIN